jgi:hypothetical protein
MRVMPGEKGEGFITAQKAGQGLGRQRQHLLLAKNSKSKPVSSPACLPGIGIKRAVRGLSNLNESPAKSSKTAYIWSTVVSPGGGWYPGRYRTPRHTAAGL